MDVSPTSIRWQSSFYFFWRSAPCDSNSCEVSLVAATRTMSKERIEYWIESPPKLWEARSRLYRSQNLKVNTHFAAFFEIYKIDILLHRSKLNFFVKNRENVLRNWILNCTKIQSIFSSKLLFLRQILMKFCRNFANVLKIVRSRWHVRKFCNILRNFRKISEILCKNSILFNMVQSCP